MHYTDGSAIHPLVAGWLLVRENPDTRPESDPIQAVPTEFGHDALSELSGSGRARTQSRDRVRTRHGSDPRNVVRIPG